MPRKYVKRNRDAFGRSIQRHHLDYQTGKFEDKVGEVVLIYRGEHWAITQMQRRKFISKGFIRAVEYWIAQVKDSAVELALNQSPTNHKV